MEMSYNFKPDGTMQGLWNDFLVDIDGHKTIERASNVEFDIDVQGWIVTIEYGRYKGCCLPQLFCERNKAIESEIEFFNKELNHE